MDFDNKKKLKDIRWHDGVIGPVKILQSSDGGRFGAVLVELAIYPPINSKTRIDSEKTRHEEVLYFEGVKSLILDFDFSEISDNANAGNINSGSLETLSAREHHLKLDIFGGHFSVTFKRAKFLAKSIAGTQS